MAVKESSASKIKFKGVDALFGLSEEQECVREIPLDELDTFKNHPFKVFRDDKMEEMIESISEYGVLISCGTQKKICLQGIRTENNAGHYQRYV